MVYTVYLSDTWQEVVPDAACEPITMN